MNTFWDNEIYINRNLSSYATKCYLSKKTNTKRPASMIVRFVLFNLEKEDIYKTDAIFCSLKFHWRDKSFFSISWFYEVNATWKVSKYGVFSGPYFPAVGLNKERSGVFSPNARKYGPEKAPYLDNFHAVQSFKKLVNFGSVRLGWISD